MLDILLFLINGGGWAIKPILEKISVDSIGYFDFVFIRYLFCGLIALFVLLLSYYQGRRLKLLKNSKLTLPQTIGAGMLVCVVAMTAALANYYLLQKYDSSFVTPIVEAVILILNAILSVVLLGETVTTDMIIGIFFILTGITFIYREKMIIFKS